MLTIFLQPILNFKGEMISESVKTYHWSLSAQNVSKINSILKFDYY